jgi:hypothetical protein
MHMNRIGEKGDIKEEGKMIKADRITAVST